MRRWLPALPWHFLVLPAPLAAIKQQMHLLGQITHCRIQARIPVPVGAGTAAAAALRLGKSLREAAGGGWAAGLDPTQAPARCPSPHQSHRGRSVPSCSSSSSWPSTPKQSQHPKTTSAAMNNPEVGRACDIQLFQQSAGDRSPPIPISPWCVQGWAGFSTQSKLKRSEVLRPTCRMARSSSREHMRNKM